MEITALKGLGRCICVFVIALHHRIAADHDFALRCAVHGHLAHFAVHHCNMFHHGKGHALTRLNRGLFVLGQIIPVFPAPYAFGDVAIGFGQAVDLGYVEPQCFDFAECGWGWWCTGRKDFDHMIKRTAVFVGRVDQHIQHDGGAAEMGNSVFVNGVIDRRRRDIATANQRASKNRHHPCVVPAIAMKQWDDGHKDWVQLHAPTDDGAHCHQIRTAMMIDDAFGPSGRPGRVIEGEAFPFIAGHDPLKGSVCLRQYVLIHCVASRRAPACRFIRHFDQFGLGSVHCGDSRFGQFKELRVHEYNLGLAMAEDVSNRVHI